MKFKHVAGETPGTPWLGSGEMAWLSWDWGMKSSDCVVWKSRQNCLLFWVAGWVRKAVYPVEGCG